MHPRKSPSIPPVLAVRRVPHLRPLGLAAACALLAAGGACRDRPGLEPMAPAATAITDPTRPAGLTTAPVLVFEVQEARGGLPRRYNVPIAATIAATGAPTDMPSIERALSAVAARANARGTPTGSAAALIRLVNALSTAPGASAKAAAVRAWARGKEIRAEIVGGQRRLRYVAADGRVLTASWPIDGRAAIVAEIDCETVVGGLEPVPDCGYDPYFDPAPMEIAAAEIVLEVDGMTAAANAEAEAYAAEFFVDIPAECRIALYDTFTRAGAAIGSAGLMVWLAKNGHVWKAIGAGAAAFDSVIHAQDALNDYYFCMQEAKIKARQRR